MEIIFTKHVENRIEKRKILREEVIDAIKFPLQIHKKHGKHFYRKKLSRGIIEVCCEKTESNINVITVYWI